MTSYTKTASNAFLVDTNVLVYVYDPRDGVKQERALLVVDRLIASRRAVVSVQCLSEFFRVVTQRLPERMTGQEALTRVRRLARVCHVLDLTAAIVVEGCHGASEHGLAIWDALIWAVAKLNQVPCVLTEDAEHGRVVEGVRFLNPFAAAFDLGLLVAEI
ncbi:MAG: PIN domain-containing protein [Chloroflexi bacterium]|nr:PIN domain-containing protein [Chloroflexota bacterium]